MKIGILTFHRTHNYGAVLQAYALQEFLTSEGYNVEIIDYISYVNRNSRLSRFFKRRNLILLTVNFFFKFHRIYSRYKAFNNYISNRYKLSKQICNVDRFMDLNHDFYILGSDQIWNKGITNGFDPVYFGNFPTNKNTKKISYAASLGTDTLSEKESLYFESALSNFSAISVREDILIKLLQPLVKKEIHKVIDPTLLVEKIVFEKILVKPIRNKGYVLIYQVMTDPNVYRIAKEIASQLEVDIIELSASVKGIFRKNNVYENVTPEEFLGWIKFATCIITTSFHGTAFSIVFERPFYSFNLNNHSGRLVSLLNELNLTDRLITPETNLKFSFIDFIDTKIRLKANRLKSKSFLLTSINDANLNLLS